MSDLEHDARMRADAVAADQEERLQRIERAIQLIAKALFFIPPDGMKASGLHWREVKELEEFISKEREW